MNTKLNSTRKETKFVTRIIDWWFQVAWKINGIFNITRRKRLNVSLKLLVSSLEKTKLRSEGLNKANVWCHHMLKADIIFSRQVNAIPRVEPVYLSWMLTNENNKPKLWKRKLGEFMREPSRRQFAKGLSSFSPIYHRDVVLTVPDSRNITFLSTRLAAAIKNSFLRRAHLHGIELLSSCLFLFCLYFP